MNIHGILVALLGSAVWINTNASEVLTLGFHTHEPKHIQAAANAGYSAIRLWDTRTDWRSLKPKVDQWQFDRIDTYLAASEKAHLQILWTIGNTPQWASARPNEKCAYGFGCAAEPRDTEDWRRYVQTIATTFRGRIECYEPWNEISFPHDPAFKQPGSGGDPGQFFSGSVDAIVTISRIVFEEVKRADPKACVTSPSFHSSGDWVLKLDRFLAAGGGKYFDVVSEHFYFGEEPERAIRMIREIKQVLAKYGLSHIPIWNTEVGWPFVALAKQWPGMTLEDLAYAMTLKTYLLNASEKIARVYWYAWDNKEMGVVNVETKNDFGSAAAKSAVRLLKGLESADCQVKGNFWQCQVRAGGKNFKVIWLAGKSVIPVKTAYKFNATRWGAISEYLPAGQDFLLDGRPVIIEEAS